MTLLDRVKSWSSGARILSDWLGSGSVVVDKELAQKRATACLSGDTDKHGKPCPCRYNQKGGLLEKSVAWAIHEQVSLKNDLELRLDGEKGLHECTRCRCQLKLKCWVPMDKLRKEETPEEKSNWPSWCWMRNEP